jgi:hypothetical protein
MKIPNEELRVASLLVPLRLHQNVVVVVAMNDHPEGTVRSCQSRRDVKDTKQTKSDKSTLY